MAQRTEGWKLKRERHMLNTRFIIFLSQRACFLYIIILHSHQRRFYFSPRGWNPSNSFSLTWFFSFLWWRIHFGRDFEPWGLKCIWWGLIYSFTIHLYSFPYAKMKWRIFILRVQKIYQFPSVITPLSFPSQCPPSHFLVSLLDRADNKAENWCRVPHYFVHLFYKVDEVIDKEILLQDIIFSFNSLGSFFSTIMIR